MRNRVLFPTLVVCFALPAHSQPLLLDAVRKDDVATAEKLLAAGLNPNPPPSLVPRTEPAVTALMLAAQRGNAEMVKLLLKYKAAPNFPPEDPPLKRAIEAGHEDIVNMLLASRAPAAGPWARSAPLTSAVATGKVNIVLALLSHGADPNQRPVQLDPAILADETPIMVAARYGFLDIAGILLARGADVNFRTEDQGKTALSIAESTQHFNVAALLIGAGARQGNFPRVPQSGASIRTQIPAGVSRLYGRFHADKDAASLTAKALDDMAFINRVWSPGKPLDPAYRMNLTVYVYSLEAAYREPDEKKAYAMFEDLVADLHVKANHCRATGTGLGGLVNISVKTQRGDAEVKAWQVFWKPKILEFAKEFRAEAFPKPSSPTSLELAPGRYLMWAQDPKTGRRGNEEVVTLGEGKKTIEKTLFVP